MDNAAIAPCSAVVEFYQRSRLHLISTLAQEMRQYVAELQRQAEDGRSCAPNEQVRDTFRSRASTCEKAKFDFR